MKLVEKSLAVTSSDENYMISNRRYNCAILGNGKMLIFVKKSEEKSQDELTFLR
jgi:hypothetical protein